jgi:hypothetical protein
VTGKLERRLVEITYIRLGRISVEQDRDKRALEQLAGLLAEHAPEELADDVASIFRTLSEGAKRRLEFIEQTRRLIRDHGYAPEVPAEPR